jgi:hypothetical protein
MGIIILCIGAVGGRVIVLEAAKHARASDGVTAAGLADLMMLAATQVSFERGPTNGALGADDPLPPERRKPLEAAHAATDATFAALNDRLLTTHLPRTKAIPGQIAATQRHLAEVRQSIDSLLAQPRTSRTEAQLNGVVNRLIAIIPELSPGLNVMEATLAQADPSLTSLITAARLTTEIRDLGGQLGSVFTAPIAGNRLMTPD